MRRRGSRAAAKRQGFRSGFEKFVYDTALKDGIVTDYEPEDEKLIWQPKPRNYLPDFRIQTTGVLVETKGQFTSDDRTKVLTVIQQNPTKDLRLVFQRDNRLSPVSETTYTGWCRQHGIQFAMGRIPKEWAIK
jgi:hypothetical protein